VGNRLVVAIPAAAGGSTTGTPTGIVFNGTSAFIVLNGQESGPSVFLFASLDGSISGWNPSVDLTHAIRVVDNSASRAGYTGLALGSNETGNFLYAVNIAAGTIDVFDAEFAPTTLAGSFSDPLLPAGVVPFGIANLGGYLYVTYAGQGLVGSPGNGFVDVFDTNGNLVSRLIAGSPLNVPWGLAIAPSNWGRFAGALLVGNFGDGTINVFDPSTGDRKGQLRTDSHTPVVIPGLRGLLFGNGGFGGDRDALYFTAGLPTGLDSLLGSLTPVTSS
jgi:uncharacterized protein (TIGR03118 family)